MQLTKLAIEILRKRKEGKEIRLSDWPSDFTIETEITTNIKRLSGYTNSNKNKRDGASGWEYEMTYILFFNKLFPSEITSGNYSQVTYSHSFSAKPEQKDDKVRFYVLIDSKKYKSDWFEVKKVNEEMIYGHVISFHTHPLQKQEGKSLGYSFFSPADLHSLLRGPSPMIGMIAGSDLWIAGRTSSSKMPDPNDLMEVSRAEEIGIFNMQAKIKELLKETDIAFYSGRVGGRMRRVI